MSQLLAKPVRVLGTLSVLVLVVTFLMAQIDLWRRHRPGMSPGRYILPQATQILLPGLAAAAILAIAATIVHRRRRARD
jgi:hypothetical protein